MKVSHFGGVWAFHLQLIEKYIYLPVTLMRKTF